MPTQNLPDIPNDELRLADRSELTSEECCHRECSARGEWQPVIEVFVEREQRLGSIPMARAACESHRHGLGAQILADDELWDYLVLMLPKLKPGIEVRRELTRVTWRMVGA
jgi:hypothetical protein